MTKYKASIQLCEGYKPTQEFLDEISRFFLSTTINSTDENIDIEFVMHEPPQYMKRYVKEFIKNHPQIYYFDMVYIRSTAFVPDRWVVWKDGRQQGYSGRVTFVEDSWDTVKLSDLGMEDK